MAPRGLAPAHAHTKRARRSERASERTAVRGDLPPLVGRLKAVHSELGANIEDPCVRELVEHLDEALEDVPLPHALTDQVSAHVHVLLDGVDAHAELVGAEPYRHAVCRLLDLGGEGREVSRAG